MKELIKIFFAFTVFLAFALMVLTFVIVLPSYMLYVVYPPLSVIYLLIVFWCIVERSLKK